MHKHLDDYFKSWKNEIRLNSAFQITPKKNCIEIKFEDLGDYEIKVKTLVKPRFIHFLGNQMSKKLQLRLLTSLDFHSTNIHVNSPL